MATSFSTSSTHSLNMRPGAALGFGEIAGNLEARGVRVAGGHSARAARQPSQNFARLRDERRAVRHRSSLDADARAITLSSRRCQR
jgi:hypothetical protein